jgi:hypothetical protein
VAFDHVAIEVPDLDGFIEALTTTGLMRLLRRGTRTGTGQRLAMLVDDQGQKVELIEGEEVRFLHLAFEVGDVDAAHAALLGTGAAVVRTPQRIEAARALSSIVRTAGGVEVQVVRYDDDSPDRTSVRPAGEAAAGR